MAMSLKGHTPLGWHRDCSPVGPLFHGRAGYQGFGQVWWSLGGTCGDRRESGDAESARNFTPLCLRAVCLLQLFTAMHIR